MFRLYVLCLWSHWLLVFYVVFTFLGTFIKHSAVFLSITYVVLLTRIELIASVNLFV